MSNEQILLETWRSLPSPQQLEVLDFIKSLQSNLPSPESSYQPKTDLGKKLWQIRTQAIAEGKLQLLDWEGIKKELASRRGEID